MRKFSFRLAGAAAPAVSGQSRGRRAARRARRVGSGCPGAGGCLHGFGLPRASRAPCVGAKNLLAFSSSRSDDHRSPEPAWTSCSRWLRVRVWPAVASGGAGPQRRVCTAARAGSGANSAARSTTTRQPCARGSRKSEPWVARQHRARTPSTSPGQRPCGARVYMAVRRATRCCARFGGRSPHRLQYQKNQNRNRCRPTCMKDSSPTTTRDRNRAPLLGGRATSTRATPWCRPGACAGPRIGTAGAARRRSCVEVPTVPIKECPP